MRHHHRLAALLIPALASVALAQGTFDPGAPASPKSPAPVVFGLSEWSTSPAASPATKAAREALDKPLAKFSVSQMPLQEALVGLAKDAGLNLTVNWAALETAGVEKSQRVTINAIQLTPRRVLRQILDDASPSANLHFLIDDGMLIVSTRNELQSYRYLVTTAYDMSFLFADVEYQSQAADDLRTMIADTLRNTFDPLSWRDNGGTVGMVRFLAGQMLITQTVDNQEAIASFVTALQSTALKSLRVYDVHDLAADKDHIDDLIDVIKTSCGRDTWRDRGGSSGSIASFDGKLYINASPVVHQQIDIMLGLMRKK